MQEADVVLDRVRKYRRVFLEMGYDSPPICFLTKREAKLVAYHLTYSFADGGVYDWNPGRESVGLLYGMRVVIKETL